MRHTLRTAFDILSMKNGSLIDTPKGQLLLLLEMTEHAAREKKKDAPNTNFKPVLLEILYMIQFFFNHTKGMDTAAILLEVARYQREEEVTLETVLEVFQLVYKMFYVSDNDEDYFRVVLYVQLIIQSFLKFLETRPLLAINAVMEVEEDEQVLIDLRPALEQRPQKKRGMKRELQQLAVDHERYETYWKPKHWKLE